MTSGDSGSRFVLANATTNLRVATRREREMIEEAGHGRLSADEQGPKRLSEAIDAYLTAKRIRCSARTIELEGERLSIVKKHFGDVLLSAITATAIADFQHARHDAGKANRTINMDVGVLSRVLKFCGRWRALADHVKNLPERQRPVGHALTPEERKRLFDAAASNAEWEHVFCAAVVAANTSMRPVEVKHLRRCDVDLVKRLVHVRRSKNETSHRVIPLNASAIEAAARMFERADLLGHTEPEHYCQAEVSCRRPQALLCSRQSCDRAREGSRSAVGRSQRRPPRSILEGRSRTAVSHRTSVAKRDQIAVSDRRTLGGLTQFLTQFGFSGSATSL